MNDCFWFPKIPKKTWLDHSDDCCPKCGEKRFSVTGNSVSPRKKFFKIPLSSQIEGLKKNSSFRASFDKMKAEISGGLNELESFWGASIAQDYLEDLELLDDFSKILLLSVGFDGVNCFKSAPYSVWPVAFKIWNLHPEERTSKDFLLLGCLIPGLIHIKKGERCKTNFLKKNCNDC